MPEYILSENILDRPSLALANLLEGRLGAAGRSIVKPGTLSPEERRSVAARLGLEGPITGPLVAMVTDPLVLVSFLFMMRFPFPFKERIAGYTGEFKQSLKQRNALLEFMSDMDANFSQTKLPAQFRLIQYKNVAARLRFLRGNADDAAAKFKHGGMLGDLKRFVGTTGRDPTVKERVLVLAGRDAELFQASSQQWVRLRQRINEAVKEGRLGAEDGARMQAVLSRGVPRGPQLSGAVKTYSDDVKVGFDDAWEYNQLGDPDVAEEVLKANAAMTGVPSLSGPPARKVRDAMTGKIRTIPAKRIVKRENYAPHQYIASPLEKAPSVHAELEEYRTFAGKFPDPKAQARIRAAGIYKKGLKAAMPRHGDLMPRPEHLRELGWSEDLIKVIDDMALTHPISDKKMFYSLDVAEALPRYYDDMAKAHSLIVPPASGINPATGKRYTGMLRTVKRTLDGLADEIATDPALTGLQREAKRFRLGIVFDKYLPLSMGGMTPSQFRAAQRWNSMRSGAIDNLAWMSEKKLLPKRWAEKLTSVIAEDKASTYGAVGSNLAEHFYVAALGAPNVQPPMLNLMQNLMGMADVPMEHRVAGFGDAVRWMEKYAEGRWFKKLSKEQALKAATPDFAAMHLELDPVGRAGIEGQLETAYKSAWQATGAGRTFAKVKEHMMVPFGGTELFNRFWAFGAGRREFNAVASRRVFDAAKDMSLVVKRGTPDFKAAANLHGQKQVMRAAFSGGYLGTPQGMVDWWGPWRQFGTFPLRTAALAFGDHRMLSRMTFAGAVAHRAVSDVTGLDVSRGLLFGGLPAPTEGRAFSPLPIVPPLLQMLGAPAMAAAQGDLSAIQESLPLLVPGGVGMAKAVGIGGAGPFGPPSRKAAEFLGKPYADYSMELPDGRIPVFSASGSLQAYYTKPQLFARIMGFAGGSPTQQQEFKLTRYLLQQRDEIRRFKQEALQALYENDGAHAQALAEEFSRRYPGLPGLPVGPSEIRSLHMRRDITRLERILETMPKDIREQMRAIIAVSFGADFPSIMGLVAPGGMTTGTMKAREPYRLRPLTETAGRVSKGLHGVKLSEKLKAQGYQAGQQARQRWESGYVGGFPEY